ncbi:MAG: hypothetical protein Q9227_000116 [Pyrenula ochraceoflavens]
MVPPLLTDKVAAITGGLTGIGRAIALSYLQHGAFVAINHLGGPSDPDHITSFQEAANAISPTHHSFTTPSTKTRYLLVPGDISDPSTGPSFISTTVTHFGRLDIFISNAGICAFSDLLDISQDLWSRTLSTNLSGAFYTIQAAARAMSTQSPPGGSIIAVSSISALVGGSQQAHYTPTKAGLLSLMQSAACALGKYDIRCNALLPGTIRTQLNDADLEGPPGSEAEAKKKYMEGRTPLGRLGRPEDLAGPAVWLGCEELSGYVTGAQILVDGGMFVNLQ